MANNPEYLKKLVRHKRVIAAARLSGWAAGYLLGILALYSLARVGWGMLTGHWVLSIEQSLGLFFVVMVAWLACELFRSRANG